MSPGNAVAGRVLASDALNGDWRQFSNPGHPEYPAGVDSGATAPGVCKRYRAARDRAGDPAPTFIHCLVQLFQVKLRV